ncbi:hypothetical protein AAY473_001636 [Plecturocebus cupreus]
MPVVPATLKAEAGELLVSRRRRLQWAEIVPLHYSLGDNTEFLSCYPGCRAMARSRLTAASASWVQVILLPQPPE